MNERRGAERVFKPGGNGGIATAVVVFIGGIIFLGTMMAAPWRADGPALSQRHIAIDSGPIFELSTLPPAPPAPPVPTVLASQSGEPAPTAPALPGRQTRVLLVCDILQPWSDVVQARYETFESELIGADIAVIGSGESDDESVIEYVATARMAVGQTPIDSEEAPSLLAGWLAAHAGVADAVVWMAPNAKNGAGEPRIFLFVPKATDRETKDRMDELEAAVTRAVLDRR